MLPELELPELLEPELLPDDVVEEPLLPDDDRPLLLLLLPESVERPLV